MLCLMERCYSQIPAFLFLDKEGVPPLDLNLDSDVAQLPELQNGKEIHHVFDLDSVWEAAI